MVPQRVYILAHAQRNVLFDAPMCAVRWQGADRLHPRTVGEPDPMAKPDPLAEQDQMGESDPMGEPDPVGEPDPKQDPMDKCGQSARRLGSSHFCHVLDSRVLLLLLLLLPGTKKTIAQTAGGRGRTAANTIASNNHPYGQRRQAICSALNQIRFNSGTRRASISTKARIIAPARGGSGPWTGSMSRG